ncbi:hypothetical protein MN116_006775 [Schistosoma mekongi]|uniref:Amidase domain-containing protein n=1 Tax=Schistosoma mekongi TaxID=38744 RepID=A0AAE1Z971_SCHME|nr:hypothetical protein MN116_006775 [Schistosoma mekongi]
MEEGLLFCWYLLPTILSRIVAYIVRLILLPVVVILLLERVVRYYMKKSELRKKLFHKRQIIAQRINHLREYLSNVKNRSNIDLLSITDMNLDDIQEHLIKGKFSPIDLLHAYQMKALQLHDSGNSGICEFLGDAEELAIDLAKSDRLPKNKQTLVGVPISLKELCSVKGYDVTYGMIKRCNEPVDEDCCIIKVLKHEGALPFILTATSQAALSLSGINPVFGDMSNPQSFAHETGGSSSGEGVLLGLRGSPVGIGTDLAGSIRIPSAFCGLAGLKPTTKRISNKGLAIIGHKKPVLLRVCVGPMGRRVDDLAKLMRTILTTKMFQMDPSVPPLLFDDKIYRGEDKPKLVIGYYEALEDPFIITSVPSVRRIVNQSVDILKQLGHTLVPFHPPNVKRAYELSMKAVSVDTKYYFQELLFAEPLNEHTKLLNLAIGIPHWMKVLVDKLMKIILGEPAAVTSFLDGLQGEKDTLDLASDIEVYRYEFQKAMEEAGNLDAIICPVFPFPAFPKSAKSIFVTPAVAYTILYNMLDYPAGTVPMGYVNEKDVENSKVMAEKYKKAGNRYLNQVFKYQEASEGLPVGVQIVGKPWQEERVLYIMKQLEASGTLIF